jgi:NAD(P)H-hydrate epimerase
MKIFNSGQIHEIDSFTIKNEPVASVDLMERASLALSKWFREHFEKSTEFVFLAGPGNNGGDAWALARILFHYGFENIRFYLLGSIDKISPDSQINHQRLIDETDILAKVIEKQDGFPYLSENEWIVDGLFGSGLSRSLDGIAKSLVDYVNDSPKRGVVSIDIPSGLFGEDNSRNQKQSIVRANYTLSFQFPKLSFFFSDNHSFVGNWKVLPIGLHPEAIQQTQTTFYYCKAKDIKPLIKKRAQFSHKGTYGHALIVAGCYGMMGASVLATRAAVASGAGLVTAHIPRYGYEIIQSSVPESLISLDESDLIFTEVNHLDNYSSIAIGPGLNTKTNTVRALYSLIQRVVVPLVIDADGINILADNPDWLKELPENTILTPHPGEFDRLTQKHNSHFERVLSQIELAKKLKVIIVLKGAHTSICDAEGNVWFNTTGNPSMARGGCGDVLTGIIASLLAQGYEPMNAVKIGVFVHGLAGDYTLKRKGFHASTPSDLITNLGKAFKKIE